MKGLPRESLIIRERRVFLRMTQENVANELDMDFKQYQRYEYGERSIQKMPFALGLKMCYLFELNPFEFIFGDQPPL